MPEPAPAFGFGSRRGFPVRRNTGSVSGASSCEVEPETVDYAVEVARPLQCCTALRRPVVLVVVPEASAAPGGTPARRARRPPRRRDRYGWSAPSCRSRLSRRRRRGLVSLPRPRTTCVWTSPAGQQRNLTLRRPPVVAVRRAPVRREADRARRRAGDLPKMKAAKKT